MQISQFASICSVRRKVLPDNFSFYYWGFPHFSQHDSHWQKGHRCSVVLHYFALHFNNNKNSLQRSFATVSGIWHFIEPCDQLGDSINIMVGQAGPRILYAIYCQLKSKTLRKSFLRVRWSSKRTERKWVDRCYWRHCSSTCWILFFCSESVWPWRKLGNPGDHDVSSWW